MASTNSSSPFDTSFPLTFSLVEARKNQFFRNGLRVIANAGDELAGTDCPICWETLDVKGGQIVVVIPDCQHAFHMQCLATWLRPNRHGQHNTCPYCRRELFLDGTVPPPRVFRPPPPQPFVSPRPFVNLQRVVVPYNHSWERGPTAAETISTLQQWGSMWAEMETYSTLVAPGTWQYTGTPSMQQHPPSLRRALNAGELEYFRRPPSVEDWDRTQLSTAGRNSAARNG